jgi:hypothetical protein
MWREMERRKEWITINDELFARFGLGLLELAGQRCGSRKWHLERRN